MVIKLPRWFQILPMSDCLRLRGNLFRHYRMKGWNIKTPLSEEAVWPYYFTIVRKLWKLHRTTGDGLAYSYLQRNDTITDISNQTLQMRMVFGTPFIFRNYLCKRFLQESSLYALLDSSMLQEPRGHYDEPHVTMSTRHRPGIIYTSGLKSAAT